LEAHEDGSPNFDCRRLLAPVGGPADVIGRAELRKAVKDLFAQPAEVALLHYSGHGTANDLDGYLVTQDAKNYDEGLAMSEVLKMANGSKTNEVVILLDCCHSGNLGSLPAIDNSKTMLREGVSILTASRSDQVSVEEGGAGLFSSLASDALEGGAADVRGDVTAPAIYAFVEGALGAWDQRPLFKSHVSQAMSLRRCTPPIAVSILRDLPNLFPLPAEDFPLSPEHEPSFGKCVQEKTLVFEKLVALSKVHLLVPVGAPHMYNAAMDSKRCRLTASGRYYWRLARNKLL
jgi:hypothetical protein